MKNNIENKISNTLFQLAQCFPQKYPLYIVGGFVRDCILGNNASLTDVDLACALNPQELKELLKDSEFNVIPNSEKLGTMLIRNSKTKEGFEYTAFRTDSYPVDSGKHSPDEVLFTKDIVLDAKRRDFKCNAVYFDIKNGERLTRKKLFRRSPKKSWGLLCAGGSITGGWSCADQNISFSSGLPST